MKANRGWNTLEADKPACTYTIKASNKKRALDNIVAQEVTQLRAEVRLLTEFL